MSTSFVSFLLAESEWFRVPCFDTIMSREQIIASILDCPSLLGDRDILNSVFRFYGPYHINGRKISRLYRIDINVLQKTSIISLLPVTADEAIQYY